MHEYEDCLDRWCVIFFFKQKTAYDMRISDWSSDVCSSDLPPKGLGTWRLALVLQSGPKEARIGFADGTLATIPYAEVKWARKWLEDQRFGTVPGSLDAVLSPGDVVPVELVAAASDGDDSPPDTYALRQIPDVGGASLALAPHTGRVLAMSGAHPYQRPHFTL